MLADWDRPAPLCVCRSLMAVGLSLSQRFAYIFHLYWLWNVELLLTNAAFLEDVAQNADLYIANQSVSMQI